MLKNLVRKSRVFSLPEIKAGSASVPHQQILKTTSSNKHRRNWGIKYNLPTKASSTLVTHSSLDNSIGMPEVEYGGRHARRLEKFVETGASVQPYGQDSIFNAPAQRQRTLHELNPKERRKLFKWASENRAEYVKAIQSRGDGTVVATNRAQAENFCGLGSSNTERSASTRSAIGLTYALKGAATNTPQGIRSERAFPARPLAYNLASSQIRASSMAAAGFVGTFNGSLATYDHENTPVVSQQRTRDVYISHASARIDGQVSVKLEASSTST